MEAIWSKSEMLVGQTERLNIQTRCMAAEHNAWTIAMTTCVKASPLLPPNVPGPSPHDALQGATGAGAGACAGSAAPSAVSLEALWAAAHAGNWATASWLLLVLRRRGQDCCHELLPFFGRKVESKVWGRARDSELAALRWLEGELERAAAR